jgi:hypothetical protein
LQQSLSSMTTLIGRLGGMDDVAATAEDMYESDASMAPFFENVCMVHLKYHQIQFMKIAFTQIPDDLDVPMYLRKRHMKLFAHKKGLNETHFDNGFEHLAGA